MKHNERMLLKEPQKYTVCMKCKEVIRYDPEKSADILQIYHEKCGGIVSRNDGRGREYQYILQIGMGETIAREVVFNLPRGKTARRPPRATSAKSVPPADTPTPASEESMQGLLL